ncbi:MAG: succinate dehydrogenase assembly factor 2 [Steroidobacterales bacterium]
MSELAWRCRRGMRELDLLLAGWLQHDYQLASSAEQALFAQFLDLPDPDLARYLLAGEQPEQPQFRALAAAIAHRSP